MRNQPTKYCTSLVRVRSIWSSSVRIRSMVFGSTTERLIRESAYAVLAVALGSTSGGRVMRAVRFAGVGRPAQIADVPKPAPGPGQIVLKIGGAGVCHSDLHVMEEDLGFKPPFTLGHENA